MADFPAEMSAWREHVLVMFADLCDYTSISESSDPEDVGELRQTLEALAQSVIQGHGGTITQVYGDGILAVFGYPNPHEDDARRAAEAALQLHRVVRAARWPEVAGGEVRLHTGIHCGLVFGRAGDAVRGRYDLTGDVVNTAARLSAAAGRDEIVISAAALGGIEGFFELEELPAQQPLKGKKLHVPAYRLARCSNVGTRHEARSRRGLTTFVGRAAIMRGLLGTVEEASRGRLGVTVITGAAGIGKSRVLEELRSQVAARAHVIWGTCESFGEMVPLEPFRHVLKQALRTSDAAPEQLLPHLRLALEELGVQQPEEIASILGLFAVDRSAAPNDGAGSALALARAISNVVKKLAEHVPVLLLLDDWQWADDSSRKVLDQILLERQASALSVIVAARSLDFTHPLLSGAQVVALQPFEEDESAQVILALRPRELQIAVTRAIHRRAGGNPLFVEELCRSLPPHALADVEALEQFGAPTTLQGAIKARVSNLPRFHTRVLCVASVIGMEFSLPLLRWVIDDAALGAALADLTDNDLIYPAQESTFRFKHGLARDVVYESILLAERRRIHGTLAHYYAQSGRQEQLESHAEALAYHYRGSGDYERAVKYAELAGDKAMLTSALDRASHQYGVALKCLDRLPPNNEVKRHWVQLSTCWAKACIYSPTRDQVKILQRAAQYADELGETGAQAQTHYVLGWTHYVLGDSEESVHCYQTALDLATAAAATRLVAQLWVNLGQSYAAACQTDLALKYLGQGIEQKRASASHAGGKLPQGFSYALGCRAAAYSYIGSFPEADRDLAEALALVGKSGHPVEGSVNALAAMVELQRGALRPCLEAARRGRHLAERANSAYVLATSMSYESYAEYKLFNEEAALRRLQLAVSYLADQGLGLFTSLAHACLADALLDFGDVPAAEAAAQRALARASQADPLGACMASRTLAKLYSRGSARDVPRARAALLDAYDIADKYGSLRERALTQLLDQELANTMEGAAQAESPCLPSFRASSV